MTSSAAGSLDKPLGNGSAERNTRQRRIVRDVFAASTRPLSPEEVLVAATRDGSGVSLSTVYRSIRLLVDDGWLAVVVVPGNNALYEVAGKAHHHHFVCSLCRRVYELDGCPRIEMLKLPRGFRATSHDITVTGVCCNCSDPKSLG
jgi:Fur family ferric uptake transcriptional regulator